MNQILRNSILRVYSRQFTRQINNFEREQFYFFKSPLLVSRSSEIFRTLLNPIYRAFYRHFIESEFNIDGFLNGAKQSLLISSSYVRDSRYDLLTAFMSKDAVKQVRRRAETIPSDVLKRYLTFSADQVVRGILHSSFTSSIFLLTRGVDSYDFTFYSTFVFFVDLKGTDKSRSLSELLKCPDILVCNLTLARILIPLGRWRITDINFFNTEFLYRNMHTVHIAPMA